MPDVSRTTYRGLVLFDERVSLNTTETTAEQAGPVPGGVEPAQLTDATLTGHGTMVAGDAVEVQVIRPGMPGTDEQAMGVVWRRGSESYRGWEQPTILRGWAVRRWAATAAADRPSNPAILACQSGAVILAYERINTGIGFSTVTTETQQAGASTWDARVSVVSHANPLPSGFTLYPALTQLNNGRVLLAYWRPELDGAIGQIAVYYSDDDGATWAAASLRALTAPLDMSGVTALGPISIAAGGDEVVLFAEIDGEVVQYASDSLGARFDEVDTLADCYRPSVTALPGGGFVVAMLNVTLDDGRAYLLGSAGAPFTAQDSVSFADSGLIDPVTVGGDGDCSITCDDAGVLWLAFRHTSNPDTGDVMQQIITRSFDGGRTWRAPGANPNSYGSRWGAWWDGNSTAHYPNRVAIAYHRGRIIAAHQFEGGSYESSLALAYLGGWHTYTQPYGLVVVTSARYRDPTGYAHTWLPFILPSDLTSLESVPTWTAAGAGTASVATGALNLSTAAQAKTYTTSTTIAGAFPADAIELRAVVDVVTGSHLSSEVVIEVHSGNGTTLEYRLVVRLGTTTIGFRDHYGAASLGTITIDVTAGVELAISVKGGAVLSYYRARSHGTDGLWTAGPSGALTLNAGATASYIMWGHELSTAESNWHEFHWSAGAEGDLSGTEAPTGETLAAQTYPRDLQSRALGSLPVHLVDGLHLAASDGPAYTGDTWDIATAYRFGLERLNPLAYRAPTEGWRSTTAGAQVIGWDFDPTLTAVSRPQSPLLALVCRGGNFRTATLATRDAAGAYTTAASIDTAEGFTSLSLSRSGNTITGTGTGTGAPFVNEGELTGWVVELSGTVRRRIVSNTEGFIGAASMGRQSVIVLEGVDAGDPTSFTGHIYSPDWICIVHTGLSGYRGLRLTIDAQVTPDGYTAAGILAVGWVELFGRDPDWGRSVDMEAQVETSTNRRMISRVRKMAPAIRTIEMHIASVLDESRISGSAPTPDHITGRQSGAAAATVQATAQTWQGIVRRIDGPRRPMLYIAQLQRLNQAAQMLNRYASNVYGELVGSVRRDNVVGLPLANEAVRGARLTVREIR